MKPFLYVIPSFDASVGITIKFSWLGNQPVSNTLIIRDNNTNVIMYEKMLQTMRLEHTIASGSGLRNGTLYNASIKVTDSNGVDSEWSDILLFYCYTTPTFKINIEPNQIIQAQTYGVDIAYTQPEGEQLQSYRVRVYNSDDILVYDSNTRYMLDTVRITNLQDNNHYSIIATGETINGMQLSTGRIDFSADFIKAEAYFVCELQNMYDTGGIYIKSNIVSVEGHSDSEVIYIDNTIADLTNNVVHFDKGFSITDNFSLLLKGSKFEVGESVLRLSGGSEIITVDYKYDAISNVYYFELHAIYGNTNYMITKINPYSTEEISLWINRKDTLFGMEVLV
jgi:hypothetical protein